MAAALVCSSVLGSALVSVLGSALAWLSASASRFGWGWLWAYGWVLG
jgi:hypothetical protein